MAQNPLSGPNFGTPNTQTQQTAIDKLNSPPPSPPVDPATVGNGSGVSQQFQAGGMNPNPTAVQQYKLGPGMGTGPGQLNAALPDGPLSPALAAMQGNVAAGVQHNQELMNQGWWQDWGANPGLKPPDDPANIKGAMEYIGSPDGQKMANAGYKWDLARRTWVAPNDTSKLSDQQKIQMLSSGALDPKSIGAIFTGGKWILPLSTSGSNTGQATGGQAPVDPATGGPAQGNTLTPDQLTQLNGMGPMGVFLAKMLGSGADNPLLKMMMGGTATPSTPATPATTNPGSSTLSQQQPVMIGGQAMRFDPVNNYYVPVNPQTYGADPNANGYNPSGGGGGVTAGPNIYPQNPNTGVGRS